MKKPRYIDVDIVRYERQVLCWGGAGGAEVEAV